jgi:hypothetical protein
MLRMGNCWSTFVALFSPSRDLTRPDDDACPTCPICLETCAAGSQETCEHGHCMHSECARKMSLHMKLQCPLCRSKLVCPNCKSGKTSIVCSCSDMSSKPEHVHETMQEICNTHLCVSIAIYFLPLNPAALLVVILLNCSLMLRRIVVFQRRCEQIQKWNRALRTAVSVTHVGMDLTTGCLIMIAAVVATLYMNAFLSPSEFLSSSAARRS